MSTKRIHNFSAGPSALPLPVLEQVQEELVDFRGEGASIMEMSHRSKTYDTIHNEAIADLKRLMDIGDGYTVLFMGGGARTQFAFLAMNLLEEKQADYLVTGNWAEQAYKQATKVGKARVIYSSAETNHDHVPKPEDYTIDADAAYLHYTSNNTIYGTEYPDVPETGKVPLVCDMSSDILSRPLDVSKFGLIYAGAQKNMGPAGVTTLIIRTDLLERSSATLPDMLSYAKVAEKNSMLNTPPVFGVYIVGLVVKHLLAKGGLVAAAERNMEKAQRVYQAIDNSNGFYRGHARPDSRSQMNVTFRLPNEDLEKAFLTEATSRDLSGLKGHRSVGGLRASIYNAVELASVEALVAFMNDFASRNA